jgi:hypothetical protein
VARQAVFLALLLTAQIAHGGPFVVFPDSKELQSPDKRFVIRSIEHTASPGEFSGLFRSLTIEDTVAGTIRGLHNYSGRVAVAWSGNNYIVVTEYLGKRTSRALVFRLDRPLEYIAINKTSLLPHISDELKARMEGNDHVYVEVSRIENGILALKVWGYGNHDPKGFGFGCVYDLDRDRVNCRARANDEPPPTSTTQP